MRKQILIIFLLCILLGFSFGERRKNITFLSPKSFYLYTMASNVNINPYNAYEFGGNESKFSMVYGFGYNLVNFYNHYKINFEFDFISPAYKIFSDNIKDTQKINFLNFKLSFQYVLPRDQVSFFVGMGVGSIHFLENSIFYSESVTSMTLQLGTKIRFSKNLSLRAEFNHFLDPGDSYTDYWGDTYYYEDDSIPIASIFSIGLELNF